MKVSFFNVECFVNGGWTVFMKNEPEEYALRVESFLNLANCGHVRIVPAVEKTVSDITKLARQLLDTIQERDDLKLQLKNMADETEYQLLQSVTAVNYMVSPHRLFDEIKRSQILLVKHGFREYLDESHNNSTNRRLK